MLEGEGLLSQVEMRQPQPTSEEVIALVHPQSHIDRVREMASRGGGYLDMDTPVSPRSYEAALYSAGAAIDALEAIFKGEIGNAFCLVRPPGHHATAWQGMGFCLFNNLAIAARYAQKNFGVERIFILDWDAHHGNGIQDIFYEDNAILYASLHQYPHYPGSGSSQEIGKGKGEGYTINLPFPPGTGEPAYLQAFEEVIMPIAQAFDPQLVMIAAGYDAHYGDLLCSMQLSSESYSKMASLLKELADRTAGGRLLASLEGGYNLTAVAMSIFNTIAIMAESELRIKEESVPKSDRAAGKTQKVIESTKKALSPYWDL
jgi:acetoin utilization deacetylase AcuC-like enzyme